MPREPDVITSLIEKFDFCDIQLLPQVSKLANPPKRRSDVNLLVDGRVPIIVANMDSIGTFEVAALLKPFGLMVAILKDFTSDDWKKAIEDGELNPRSLIPTLGLRNIDGEIERVRSIVSAFPEIDIVCLDVANGYLRAVADAVRRLKDALPHIKVCAGNVVEEKGLMHLAAAGADIIKVGIGSGGVCLTRKMTGIGCPQFSAIHDLAPLAKEMHVALVSDGGMTDPGSAVKAFAAGADFIMAGSYFAGHEETGSHFHGMSSHKSRGVRGEEVVDYRASEGREVVLVSKGSLAHTVQDLLGGIRSGCTYLGLDQLSDLKTANIQAIRVGRQLNRIQGIVAESI
jgi:GMP reductase